MKISYTHLKIWVWGFLVLCPMVILPTTPSLAADTVQLSPLGNEPSCQVEEQIAKLKKVQLSAPSDSMEDIQKQIRVRREVLGDVLYCMASETRVLRDNIGQQIEISSPTAQELQEQFLGKLDAVVRYYELARARVDGLGVRGTQEMSAIVREWRTSNYLPLAQQSFNFSLWVKNEKLIPTAQNRLDTMHTSVDQLGLDEKKTEAVQVILRETRNALIQAQKSHDKAREALLRFVPPQNSYAPIKDTLSDLSRAYANLVKVSELGK